MDTLRDLSTSDVELSKTLADAGVAMAQLPLTPERVWLQIQRQRPTSETSTTKEGTHE